MAKTVLITGVSSGIGRLTAELMAQRGWQVAATSRDPSALGTWAGEHKVTVVQLDVTDEANMPSLNHVVIQGPTPRVRSEISQPVRTARPS